MEPWLDRVADLSVQLCLMNDRVEFAGITRFWTSPGGRYRGAWIGRWDHGLSAELRRTMTSREGGRPLITVLKGLAREVALELLADGFHGNIGVDALLYRTSHGVRLKPLVEVNPRITMGRIALELRRRLHAKSCGVWAFLSRREIERAGFTSFQAFSKHIEQVAPVALHEGRMCRGALLTTDPTQATTLVTLLVVGESPAEVQDTWAACVANDPALSVWFL